MPTPRKNESKDDFIQRCMADDTMQQDYPDDDQRLAICHSQWDDEKASARSGYSIKAKKKTAEIWIYEDIGDGWMGGVSAKQFAKDVKAIGKVETIQVYMNSPGGVVFDGIAIYNTLKRNAARILMDIDGLAASIASLVVMAGDEIRMAKNAMMMIHDPWTVTGGTAAELREMADTMDKIKDQILGTYVDRTGSDEAMISDLMAAETWMSADEALEHGFADEITEAQKIAAHFDLSKFKNVPSDLSSKFKDAKIIYPENFKTPNRDTWERRLKIR
jgi:ATP-dependent Clp protease protease subunit